jgi:isoamylase
MPPTILPGQSYPLGATVYAVGVNFCVYSKHATGLDLLLFDAGQPQRNPGGSSTSTPMRNRTFYYWHVFVPGSESWSDLWLSRSRPLRSQPGTSVSTPPKFCIDPYARAVVGDETYDRKAAITPGDNCATALKRVVVDTRSYDWEGDRPLRHPLCHQCDLRNACGWVHPPPLLGAYPSGQRGTFAGLIEKIPYLKDLGITAVELLPIHQFDPQDAQPWSGKLLGLQHPGLFRPPPGLQLPQRSRWGR